MDLRRWLLGRYDHSRPLRSAHHCLGGKCHRGRHQRGHHQHDHDHDHGQWSQVGIQYRVASLAFLYFDTEDVPGNAGIIFNTANSLHSKIPQFAMYGCHVSCVPVPQSAGISSKLFLQKSDNADPISVLVWIWDKK